MKLENQCSNCRKNSNCSLKNDMITILSAIANCEVYLGNRKYKAVRDFKWLEGCKLTCRLFQIE